MRRIASRAEILAATAVVLASEAGLAGHPAVSVALALGGLGVAVARRRPQLVAIGLAVLVVLDAAAGGRLVTDTPGPLLAAVATAFCLGRADRSLGSALAGAGLLAGLVLADQLGGASAAVADDLVFYAVLVGLAWAFGAGVADRAAQISELERRTAVLRREREDIARAARGAEHVRLSRAVHAAVAQRVGAIAVQAEGARRQAGSAPGATLAALGQIEAAAREALEELRAVLGTLHDHRPGTSPPAPASGEGGPSTAPPRPPVGALDVVIGTLAGGSIAVELLVTGLSRGPAAANVLIGAAIGAPLVLRRRAPVLALGLVLGSAIVQDRWLTPIGPLVTPLVPAVVAPYAVGSHAEGRAAWAGLALAAAGVVVLGAGSQEAAGAVALVAITAGAWTAGRLLAARSRRTAQLAGTARELEDAVAQRRRLAVAEQRAFVARELHDVVAHAMTVVCLQAGAAQRTWDADPARGARLLELIGGTARDALTHTRDALALLDPSERWVALQRVDLEALAEPARAAGLAIEVAVDGVPQPLPSELGLVAYRVVQEALTNAARHAAPTDVRVRLTWTPQRLGIEVRDSGPPSVGQRALALGSGRGLLGMRERVEACAGQLLCGPQPEGGYRVSAVLPLGAVGA